VLEPTLPAVGALSHLSCSLRVAPRSDAAPPTQDVKVGSIVSTLWPDVPAFVTSKLAAITFDTLTARVLPPSAWERL
jgi:hypothetical protein